MEFLEKAVNALGASPAEADVLKKVVETGPVGVNAIRNLVNSRSFKVMLVGPAGSGKTSAAWGLAQSLPQGIDCLDVDHDSSALLDPKWRVWSVEKPTPIPDGGKPSDYKTLGKQIYKAVDESYKGSAREIKAQILAGKSSGIAIDTISTLIDTLFTAKEEALGLSTAEATEGREKMELDRLRSQLFSIAPRAIDVVCSLAELAAWHAPAGPVVGVSLVHARAQYNAKREFEQYSLALGPATAMKARARVDVCVAIGMGVLDGPDKKKLRYTASVDESDDSVGKMRWPRDPATGQIDQGFRKSATKKIEALDLAGFVADLWSYKRAQGFRYLESVAG